MLQHDDLEKLCERGQEHVAATRLEEANEAFSRALELDPRYARALYGRASCLRKLGEYAEGQHVLNRALFLHPTDTRLLNEQGFLHLGQRHYDKAVEAFTRALAVDPNDKLALEGKIRTLRLAGRFEEASGVIAEAIGKFPQSEEILTERAYLYYDQKKYDEAVEAFIEAGNQDAPLEQVRSLRDEHKFVDCGQLISAALKRLPKNVALLTERGFLYFDQKDYSKAAKAFEEALSIEPANEDGLRFKSIALRFERNFAEAEMLLQHALSLLPQSSTLLNERGWLHFDQGHYDKAVEAFDRTLDADPDNEDALQWKIRSLREQHNTAGGEALKEAIENALKQLPFSARILCERGQWHHDRNEVDEADKWYAKAIKYSYSSYAAYFLHAEALHQLDRSHEGLDVLQTLKRDHPNDLEVRARLGWFYLTRRELERAEDEFHSILETDSKNILAINGLGGVYAERNLYESAERKFRQVLELDPNEPAWHTNLAFALIRQAQERQSPSAPIRRGSVLLQTLRGAIPPTDREASQPVSDCFREAEEHCRTALKLYPGYGPAYAFLGKIAFKRGNLIESEELFKKSITLDPKGGADADLGALYAHVGRYKEAAEFLESVLKRDKNDERARLELGNVYLQIDRAKEAIAMFRQAIGTNPKSGDAPRALAISLMRAGEFTEAARVLRKAVRELGDSQRWQLHLTLCQLLAELGDKSEDSDLYEEALKEACTAIALRPEEPAPYFYSGIVHYKLENYPRALANFRRCLERDPNHFEAEQNARRVKSLLRRERIQTRGGLYAGIALAILCLGMLGVMSVLYLYFNTPKNISEATVVTMSPILLGLAFVAFLLPWLSRLKLPGVEAELSKPKEKVSAGPSGSVSFGSSPISSGPK